MFAEPASLHPPRRSPADVAIVGNAPEGVDHSRRIDGAEWVVRFNNAAGFGGRTGRRTTHLALVNRGGQMREWLADANFTQRPAVAGARSFLLPFPQEDGRAHAASADGRDWTRPALRALRPLSRPVHVLPHALHRLGRAALTAEFGAAQPNPSTGFLVAFLLHRRLQGTTARIHVYGFGFEGWPGHPWAAERAWFAAREREGALRLVPPAA